VPNVVLYVRAKEYRALKAALEADDDGVAEWIREMLRALIAKKVGK
jgi:hypothetical protein